MNWLCHKYVNYFVQNGQFHKTVILKIKAALWLKKGILVCTCYIEAQIHILNLAYIFSMFLTSKKSNLSIEEKRYSFTRWKYLKLIFCHRKTRCHPHTESESFVLKHHERHKQWPSIPISIDNPICYTNLTCTMYTVRANKHTFISFIKAAKACYIHL